MRVDLQPGQTEHLDDANEPFLHAHYRYNRTRTERFRAWLAQKLYNLSLMAGGLRGRWEVEITYSDDEPGVIYTRSVRKFDE